jgi:ligand-binding sensor domain-containing protein
MMQWQITLWLFLSFSSLGLSAQSTMLWSTYRTDNSGLPGPVVSCLERGNGDTLWIGTSNGLAFMEDSVVVPVTATNGWFIKRIRFSPDGRMYLATLGDGVKIRNNNGTFSGFGTGALQLTDNHINDIAFDAAGIWFGSQNQGLFQFDGQNWLRFSPQTTNGTVPFQRINQIQIDGNGNRWLATQNAGLYNFPQTGPIIALNIDSGMPNNSVQCMLMENDTMWIGFGETSSNNNLARLSVSSRQIEIYSPANSNQLAHRNIQSIYRDNEGVLWFASNALNGYGLARKTDSIFEATPILSNGEWVSFVFSIASADSGSIYAGHIHGLSINRLQEGLETSISEIEDSFNLLLVPNPAVTNTQIQSSSANLSVQTIQDITGRAWPFEQNGQTISWEAIPSGIYFVEVKTEERISWIKLMIR